MPRSRSGSDGARRDPFALARQLSELIVHRRRRLSRRLILDSAAEHFARAGFHATRIADVCEDTDLPKTQVYEQFVSKDQLLRAVLVRERRKLLAGLRPTARGVVEGSALEAGCREVVARLLDYAGERPYALRVLFGRPDWTREREVRAEAWDGLVQAVEAILRAGDPDLPDDASVTHLATVLTTLVVGLAESVYEGRISDVDARRVAESYVRGLTLAELQDSRLLA
jgi:AcrR family transcriptional regulator